jgi:DME family drug/metabolite transporter
MPHRHHAPAPLGSRLRVLAAAALFSTGGAAIKAVSLSGLQVACLRATVASLALFLLVPESRRRPPLRVLAISVCHALTMVLFVQSNKLTTSASAIFLQATAPLWVLLLAPWLLKERTRRSDLITMGVIAVGLGLFFVSIDKVSETAPNPILGDAAAVVSGLFWAFTLMGMRWAGRRAEGGEAESWGPVAALGGNVICALLCLPFAAPFPALHGKDLLLLAYLGSIQIALAYVFLLRGLEEVPAFQASLLLLLEPVLNPIWSWIVHGETPGPWALAGGVLILAATVLKSWVDSRSLKGAAAA